MEITVISEEENPMLHRTDVRFRVSHAEATPDRLAVRDSLAARLNKDADEVVVRSLDTKFGMRETVGEAKVYQGAEVAADVEQEYVLARNKVGDRGAEESESVEEPADEPEPDQADVAEASEVAEPEEAEDAPDGDADGAGPEQADEDSAEADESATEDDEAADEETEE